MRKHLSFVNKKTYSCTRLGLIINDIYSLGNKKRANFKSVLFWKPYFSTSILQVLTNLSGLERRRNGPPFSFLDQTVYKWLPLEKDTIRKR